MTDSKEIEKVDDRSGDLVIAGAEALNDIASEFDDIGLVLPLVTLQQGQSASVKAGDAEDGDYYNYLTGESLGSEFEFVIVDIYKGRLWTDDSVTPKRTYSAHKGQNVVPESWEGHPDKGKPWGEVEGTEEWLRREVNAGNREWGRGPEITTTYNFVGFDPNEPEFPFRLSLKRSSAPSAKRLISMVRTSKAPWFKVYKIGSSEFTTPDGTAQSASVSRLRNTTDEERAVALDYHQQIKAVEVVYKGDEFDEDGGSAPSEPAGAALKV